MNKDEIDLLDKTLSKTNDWVKFAEAKNGAMTAVVCTVIFGANKAVSDLNEVPNYLFAYFFSFFILSILSLVTAISSFIPRLKKPFWRKAEERSAHDNPFYFGHACKYDGYSYLKLMGIENKNTGVTEKLADQIVINSRIASQKYSLFTGSAWLFLSALITGIM